MTDAGRNVVVADEIERAHEELQAADALRAASLARVAVTRTYFAVFHAIRAILYAHGIEPKTHHGALALFNLNFVRPGTYDPATSRLLARLQKYREEADYGTGIGFDDAAAKEEIDAAKTFVAPVTSDALAKLGG